MAIIDFGVARKAMVDTQIAVHSVVEPRLLSALLTVPREHFVPEHRRYLAYSDAPHDIGGGRLLSSPVTFARLAQLAAIGPEDRVLDFGCGSGYSSANFSKLAKSVVAYESDKDLARIARHNLDQVGAKSVSVVTAEDDALLAGSFDAIMIEGAVVEAQGHFLDRLAMGGRLVAVVGAGITGVATVWTRTSAGVVSRSHFHAKLPALPLNNAAEEFVF